MTYELLYIVPSKFSETEIADVTKIVEGLLTKHEAKVLKTENLGKIKFAYPIKKFTHGTYILTYIEVAGEKIKDLDLELKLASEVLRHVFVKREKGIPEFEFKVSSYVAPLTSEGKRATAPSIMQPKPEAPKRVEAKAEPVSEEKLEEKLDEILEGDIVEEA